MIEIDQLEQQIRKDMEEIGQPMSIRSAASIAERYRDQCPGVSDDEAEAIVRKVAAEKRFTVF